MNRQEQGIAAASQLAHQRTPYGASLSFATTTHLWLPSDPPSRNPASTTSRQQSARSIPGRVLAAINRKTAVAHDQLLANLFVLDIVPA